jgi:predicted Zn-dependent protease
MRARTINILVFLFVISITQPQRLAAHPELLQQIDDLTSQIAQQPASGVLYLRRAQLHTLHADFTSALADFARAERNGAERAGVLLARGSMYVDAQRFSEADREVRQLLSDRPQLDRAHLLHAHLLEQTSHPLEAADELSSTIQLSSSPLPEWYIRRADLLANCNPRQTSQALACLDAGMLRLGPLVTLRIKAVQLARDAGDTTAAATRLEQLIQSAPRKETYLVQLTELYSSTNQRDLATSASRQARQAIAALPRRIQSTSATQQLLARLDGLEASQ